MKDITAIGFGNRQLDNEILAIDGVNICLFKTINVQIPLTPTLRANIAKQLRDLADEIEISPNLGSRP